VVTRRNRTDTLPNERTALMSADAKPVAMVVILPVGYRARCVGAGCRNDARAIVRYADAAGRPLRLKMCVLCTCAKRRLALRPTASRFTTTGTRDPSFI
jgi:hypothetical protein